MSRCLVCLALTLICVAPALADDPPLPPELDTVANPRLLDTHFARFGFEPLKRIHRQDEWLRIRLPATTKERQVGQTGVYSYVALAGDFEVEATYGFGAVPEHKGGYGLSCGIAVDTNEKEGMLALARAYGQDIKSSGYAVTQRKVAKVLDPEEEVFKDQTEYPTEFYPTHVKTGRLSIRRQKSELICLTQEGKDDWQELCRVPYTLGTVRQIRLYGDTGGSASDLDVWIGSLRVRAEEITGGFPKRGRRAPWTWWHAMLGLIFATAALWLLGRRQQRKWPWPEHATAQAPTPRFRKPVSGPKQPR